MLALIGMSTLFLGGCGQQTQGYKVDLEVWGLFDESVDYAEIINQYRKINPYVGDIKYRKFTPETYSRDLLEALASGKGPDIFLIHNSWVPSYLDRIEPAPKPIMSQQEVEATFTDVVAQDFVHEGSVYGLPLSVDSLALYYNKDLFNAAGITQPPKTWLELEEAARKLTILDANGTIAQAGVALGTAQNINRATDVLSMIMMQLGTEFPKNSQSVARFEQGTVGEGGQTVLSGEQALGYYVQFSKLSGPLYTWNARMHNSLEAFEGGRLGMMFNYSYQAATLKSKNPKLSFGVAEVPQAKADKPVNYANYWGYAVSKFKAAPLSATGSQIEQVPNEIRTHEAWQFLRFLAAKNSGTVRLYNAVTKASKDFPVQYDPALEYLKRTNKPAARRDIIELQKTDGLLGAFAYGNLISRSWYRKDPALAESVFAEAIESVSSGQATVQQSLKLMSNRLNFSQR